MNMKIKPINFRVLVEPEKISEITKSGLIKPKNENDKDEVMEGKIISVSKNVEFVEIGQKVIFGEYAGDNYLKYKLLKESEILGIIKN